MRCFRLVLLCTLESISQLIFLFIQRNRHLTAVRLDEPGVPAWSVPAVSLPPPP